MAVVEFKQVRLKVTSGLSSSVTWADWMAGTEKEKNASGPKFTTDQSVLPFTRVVTSWKKRKKQDAIEVLGTLVAVLSRTCWLNGFERIRGDPTTG